MGVGGRAAVLCVWVHSIQSSRSAALEEGDEKGERNDDRVGGDADVECVSLGYLNSATKMRVT